MLRAATLSSSPLALVRKTLPEPVIQKLKVLEKRDLGISDQAAKDVSMDLEARCSSLNEGPLKKWATEKETIEKTYKQSVVFDQAREFIEEIRNDVQLLKSEVWNRRIADVSCMQGGQLSQAYINVVCLDYVAFRSYSLDIRQLTSSGGEGEIKPITVKGMQEALGWPEGNLIVNQQMIPILSSMSLTDVMFAVNQAGQGAFQMTYTVIQPPASDAAGQIQLAFDSLQPDIPLIFDDDQSGNLLAALGFPTEKIASRTAVITLNETLTIERPTNVMKDVIPGMTLELRQLTPPEAKGFLRIAVRPVEDLILGAFENLVKTLGLLHAHLEVHAPREPHVEGLLKPFTFLRMLYADLQAIFSSAFGPKDPQGRQSLARDFGFIVQDQLTVFNPETLRRQLVSPELCRTFFSRVETVDVADIGIVSLPPSFWGEVKIRLTSENAETSFFLQALTDRVEIKGVVQGTTCKGPKGHPLETLQMFFGAATTKALSEGKTITAKLRVVPGLVDALSAKLDGIRGQLENTVAKLKETTQKAHSKIMSLNKELDEKRRDLSKQAATFQKAYTVTTLQMKFNQQLFKSLDKDSK